MTTQREWRHRGEKDKTPLHYRDCGLDDIYLVSGYEIVETSEGKGLTIKNLDNLLEAIGLSLAKQKKVLSGKELRFLRKQMDLTQSNLSKLLGVTSQSVARWEKDEIPTPGPADLLVRALFIQHAGKTLNLQSLAKLLDEMDAPRKERRCFESTAQGWALKKAA